MIFVKIISYLIDNHFWFEFHLKCFKKNERKYFEGIIFVTKYYNLSKKMFIVKFYSYYP